MMTKLMFHADVSLNEQLISFLFSSLLKVSTCLYQKTCHFFSESFNLFECFLLPSSAVIFCFVDLCFVFNFVDLCFFSAPSDSLEHSSRFNFHLTFGLCDLSSLCFFVFCFGKTVS